MSDDGGERREEDREDDEEHDREAPPPDSARDDDRGALASDDGGALSPDSARDDDRGALASDGGGALASDDDPDGPPSDGGLDDVDVRDLLRGALRPPEGSVAPELLSGVQQRLRARSRGRFYGDGWSTASSPRSTYLVTSALMLVLILVVAGLLIPWEAVF